MCKYVILRDENRVIDGLLMVKNYDESFAGAFDNAVFAWMQTDEEFSDFVFDVLRKRGYEFDVLDYEIVNS